MLMVTAFLIWLGHVKLFVLLKVGENVKDSAWTVALIV
jgi:hypothetical protein